MPPTPDVSRRDRALGAPSARSTLLTLLGEYVFPAGCTVWTSTVIEAFAALGVEQNAARQALARTASRGWLAAEKVGRQVRWRLTPAATRLLGDGTERIYGLGRHGQRWDGSWVLLLASVPEARRDLRHRLRGELSWAGFGSLGNGTWLSPHSAREAEARRVLERLDLTAHATSFVARSGGIGEPSAVVEAAWDLRTLADAYQAFVDELGAVGPTEGSEAFVACTQLVHAWRRFPFLDPDLPAELLPPDWVGWRAADLFASRHAQLSAGSRAWWAEREAAGGPRNVAGLGRAAVAR